MILIQNIHILIFLLVLFLLIVTIAFEYIIIEITITQALLMKILSKNILRLKQEHQKMFKDSYSKHAEFIQVN
jgi:hypothetical protein